MQNIKAQNRHKIIAVKLNWFTVDLLNLIVICILFSVTLHYYMYSFFRGIVCLVLGYELTAIYWFQMWYDDFIDVYVYSWKLMCLQCIII